MAEPEFGFTCGEFTVVLSGNNIILPGSKNAPLGISLLSYVDPHDAAGAYTMQATSEGKVVCDLSVQVVWVEHKTQREPFLGFRVEKTGETIDALTQYTGKRVELKFTRSAH
jgi:hypothetical protein